MSTSSTVTGVKMLDGQVTINSQKCIAMGGFGDIYVGTQNDQSGVPICYVAIKMFRGAHLDDKKEDIERRLKRESIVWSKLDHKNVLPFLGLCSNFGPSLALISPYCEFGHVMKYLGEYPGADRLAIVKGVANGLSYLHEKGVIHGDLKGHNILIDAQGIPRICDFGRSKIIDHVGFTTPLPGTYRYLAPELAAESVTVPKLTMQTDVYSFSMVALEVLTGKVPFDRLTDIQVIPVVVRGDRPKRERYNSPALDDRLWALLGRWWAQDPYARPNMQGVVSALKHM